MNIQQITELAKQRGMTPPRLKKADLIHFIQREEGNFDCFATATDGFCDQQQCAWRQDCLKQSSTATRSSN